MSQPSEPRPGDFPTQRYSGMMLVIVRLKKFPWIALRIYLNPVIQFDSAWCGVKGYPNAILRAKFHPDHEEKASNR